MLVGSTSSLPVWEMGMLVRYCSYSTRRLLAACNKFNHSQFFVEARVSKKPLLTPVKLESVGPSENWSDKVFEKEALLGVSPTASNYSCSLQVENSLLGLSEPPSLTVQITSHHITSHQIKVLGLSMKKTRSSWPSLVTQVTL